MKKLLFLILVFSFLTLACQKDEIVEPAITCTKCLPIIEKVKIPYRNLTEIKYWYGVEVQDTLTNEIKEHQVTKAAYDTLSIGSIYCGEFE